MAPRPPTGRSSRLHFAAYLDDLRQRLKDRSVSTTRDMSGKTRSLERSRPFIQLLRRFWTRLGEHRGPLVKALFGLMLATLLALAPLYAPKVVVDYVLGDQPWPGWISGVLPDGTTAFGLLVWVLVASLAVTVVCVGVGLWSRWEATRISKRLMIEARADGFDHAAKLPLHRVYDLRSGGVASLLRDDAGASGSLLFEMLYNPTRAVVQLTGSLLVLVWVDWRLLGLALAVLPVIWLTHRTWIGRIRPMWRDVRLTRKHVDSHATEVFGGMRVVRAFGRSRSEASRFVHRNDLMARQEIHTWWWSRGVETAWALMIPVATAALLFFGGWRILADRQAVLDGTMAPTDAFTIGGLVAFLTYLAALLGPIATLAATAANLQNSLAGFDRFLDLMDEPAEMPAPDTAPRLTFGPGSGRIAFEGVGYRYPKTDRDALSGVDLVAKPGTVTALVGPSGAGKTTLCNLAARFYDPTQGRVTLDGRDLRDFDVADFRQHLGVVEQDVFLFDGSVADNIAYGKRRADEHAIRAAAQAAGADTFIEALPKGYQTRVGERGVKLSGGQRQRLAIARALLADPRVLILDEATSNLDTESEQHIQNALAKLTRDRTCFVIAHRLSTIRHADQIAVIEDARLIELGTHDELMARSGRYAEMVEAQTRPAEPAGDPNRDAALATAFTE
ncbi:MAG: ABC transporter ATP-binding protein [Planctomycetota bacterium]